jgi:hypothetical protein
VADTRNAASGPGTDALERDQSTTVELIVAWLWVGIPLAWGVWHVFLTSLKLFQ